MDIRSMLITGSVWKKTNSDSNSIVLYVTNTNLPKKIQAKFPPQVVFRSTTADDILSVDVDVFVASRKYIGLDRETQDRLENLFAESDNDDLPPIDDLEVPEEIVDQVKPVPAVAKQKINVGKHHLAQTLDHNFVTYSEEPYLYNNQGDTLHKLVFALKDGLTLNELHQSFVVHNPNSIQNFIISSEYERTVVNIDAYITTLLQVDNFGEYGTIYLLSNGAFRTFAEPLVEPVVEPLVATTLDNVPSGSPLGTIASGEQFVNSLTPEQLEVLRASIVSSSSIVAMGVTSETTEVAPVITFS